MLVEDNLANDIQTDSWYRELSRGKTVISVLGGMQRYRQARLVIPVRSPHYFRRDDDQQAAKDESQNNQNQGLPASLILLLVSKS